MIGTLTVVADNVDSPRWTVTPEPNVATYHWMLIASGAPSFVTLSNWIVVDDASRPRSKELTGRSPLLRAWKIRNDLLVSTAEIVIVWTPFVLLTAVPLCTC